MFLLHIKGCLSFYHPAISVICFRSAPPYSISTCDLFLSSHYTCSCVFELQDLWYDVIDTISRHSFLDKLWNLVLSGQVFSYQSNHYCFVQENYNFLTVRHGLQGSVLRPWLIPLHVISLGNIISTIVFKTSTMLVAHCSTYRTNLKVKYFLNPETCKKNN